MFGYRSPSTNRRVRAILFDTFGTVVDWRSGITAAVQTFRREHDITVDAEEFAMSWRERYQPSMEPIRSGARSYVTLDVLHRESLEAVLQATGVQASAIAEHELQALARAGEAQRRVQQVASQVVAARITQKQVVDYSRLKTWLSEAVDPREAMKVEAPASLVGKMLVDFSAGVPSAEAIQSQGFIGAIRYISDPRAQWMHGKPLRKQEADALRARGMVIVSNFQYGKSDWAGGAEQGRQDAVRGIQLHRDAGGPHTAAIYVSVDASPTEEQWNNQVRPYLLAWQERLGKNRMGIYCNYPCIDWAIRDGIGSYFWMHNWGSNGRVHPAAHLHQFEIDKQQVAGIGVDRNRILKHEFGQWDPAVSIPPIVHDPDRPARQYRGRYDEHMPAAQAIYDRLAGAAPAPQPQPTRGPWVGDPVWLPEVLRAEGVKVVEFEGWRNPRPRRLRRDMGRDVSPHRRTQHPAGGNRVRSPEAEGPTFGAHPGGVRGHLPRAPGGCRRLARTGGVVLRHQGLGRGDRLE